MPTSVDEDDLLVEWDDYKSIFLSSDFENGDLSMRGLNQLLYNSEETVGERYHPY